MRWNVQARKDLEKFICEEILFGEWNKIILFPSLSHLDNLMFDAGCPSFTTLIYGKGFKLFEGSIKNMADRLQKLIKKNQKKAPE